MRNTSMPAHHGLRIRLLAASALAAGFAFPAFAQGTAQATQDTATQGGLEEIVVTAERREEKLRDVPIAVTSFNAASLQERNITDIRGIQGFAPNVALVQSPGYQTETDLAIRGGVTINPAPYWDPTAGLYVDGVFIPKAIGNVTDMANLDHIEVLRGPQGTLYGRNSLGGAVNIVTKKPTGEFDGYVTLGAGNYGSTEARGLLDLPKFGILSVQLSGVMVGHDGYINAVADPFHSPLASSPYLGKYDSLNSRSGRIALRADVTDDITLDYTYDISYQVDTPNYSQLTNTTLPFLTPYIQHGEGPSAGATNNGGFESTRPFEVANVRAHALTATWDVSDELTLKSISSLRWIDWSNNLDLDGSPINIAGTELFSHYHSASEEIQASGQIDRFHYTVGAFYFDDGGYTYNPQQYFAAFGPAGETFNSQYGYGTQNYAGYGQVDYVPPVLDDKLTVTFGLRYNNETKFGSRFESLTTGAPATTTVLIPNTAATKNYDSTTPMAVVKYAITDDMNVYAKYAEGFKSGGFNGEAPTQAEALTPFQPETVDEYEIGLKSRWLDGKLNLNVAAFYDQHSNLQLSVFTGTNAASSVVRNAGSADIDGVEFDFQALPVSWLSLTGAVGYLNTAYNTFLDLNPLTGKTQNYANDRAFPYAPQFTASMSGDATLMDNDFGKLNLIVDYRHSDAYYQYPYSFSANPAINNGYYAGSTKASPQNIFDARLRLTNIQVPDGTVDIEMWGKNITNDKYRINGIPFPPSFGSITVSYYGDPPTFGGDVTYHFGKHEEAAAETTAYVPPPVAAPAPSVPHSYLVFFDFNKSDLTSQAVSIVDQAAKNAGPAHVTQLTVTGHTDTVGSDAYNMRLSRRRAEAVAAQLEKDGIASSEIEIVAKGKRDLLVPTADGVKEPQNRRVQIVYDNGPTS
jgi:iron complex outermembrane recepter protein